MKFVVEVSFLSAGRMRGLNQKWRGKSYVPAVLSFPYFEKTREGMLLGEILISKSEARKLAKKNKVAEEEQVNQLIVHGIRNIVSSKIKIQNAK